MRRFKQPAVVACFAALLSLQLKGCAEDFELAIADEVAFVTSAYCMAPAELRAELRQVIDANAAPNRVRVECAADAL